ncbi:MAG TPA: EfeM/EfeO family lipoprotein [Streptosporangiaceae bacterium]|nr:EfeM/EfeO family lipoprotein [Streptosporangiaceae bacterium]
MTARPGAWLVAGIVVTMAAAGVAACSASPQASVITVSTGACGTGWVHPFAGLQTLQLRNESTAAAEVDLIDPANGAVYAEVEALGPGTTAPMQVDVGSGSYAFRCLIEDVDPLTGPVVKVIGHVRGASAILPITSADLLPAASQYHAYVTAGLQVLAGQARTLAADVKSGNLAAARAAWLPAHLTYERLGAAYGTFGDYDTEIDGRPDGLPGGLSDPHFTGFYRLEYGLWHGQSASELTPVATQLDAAAAALSAAFKNMEIDLLDIGLRTHEILENALEFQLTGHDDYGSGTTLATTVANITGTRELLQVLHPLLAVRDQGLPSAYFWLSRLQSLLEAQQSGGHWTPVSALSTSARQQIDAAAGQALTELAPIAVITEPRRA